MLFKPLRVLLKLLCGILQPLTTILTVEDEGKDEDEEIRNKKKDKEKYKDDGKE